MKFNHVFILMTLATLPVHYAISDSRVKTAPQSEDVDPQFMSTIQFAMQESSPEMLQRSSRVLKEQFARSIEAWPELQGQTYEVRSFGNEVVFYLATPNDMRVPMQRAVSGLIQNLNGRVRTRGRSAFYHTPLTQSTGGYLETAVDDTHTKILSISAQSVSLRELLKQLKGQLGAFSYLIPGECAERRVDWNLGETQSEGKPEGKPIAAVMSELATLFNLKLEQRGTTHIFSGTCDEAPTQPAAVPAELLTTHFLPNSRKNPAMRNVYFPIMRLGQ